MVKLSMTIKTQLEHNGYLEKIKNGIPFVIKSADLPSVSWDEVLSVMNEDILNDMVTEKVWLNEYGFRITNIDRINSVKPITAQMEDLFEKASRFVELEDGGHELYVSLTTQDRAYGGKVHIDIENVIFWGLCGISNWTIYDDENKPVITEDIGPGDLIFCPIGTKHKVVAVTPRAGISFSLGSLREQF
jgi:hypothetical protein